MFNRGLFVSFILTDILLKFVTNDNTGLISIVTIEREEKFICQVHNITDWFYLSGIGSPK